MQNDVNWLQHVGILPSVRIYQFDGIVWRLSSDFKWSQSVLAQLQFLGCLLLLQQRPVQSPCSLNIWGKSWSLQLLGHWMWNFFCIRKFFLWGFLWVAVRLLSYLYLSRTEPKNKYCLKWKLDVVLKTMIKNPEQEQILRIEKCFYRSHKTFLKNVICYENNFHLISCWIFEGFLQLSDKAGENRK